MEFKTKPYEHQLTAFERFKDSEYFALFMDMGTGKTKTIIDISAHKYVTNQIDAVLIIAPNHVHSQWVLEQLPMHCPIPYESVIWSSGKSSSNHFLRRLDTFSQFNNHKLKFFAVNVEAFQSDSVLKHIATYVKRNRVFTVVDEATRIKTPTAKRSKNIHRLNKYGQRAILTGTPSAKSPFDLWSQFEFLKANYFDTTFFIFKRRYGIMMKGTNRQTGKSFNTLIDERTFNITKAKVKKLKEERGVDELCDRDYEMLAAIMDISEKNVRFIAKAPKYTRFKRVEELKEMIAPITYSIKKEQCLDLPAKVYEPIYLEMGKEQKRIYVNLKQQLIAEFEGQELTVQNKVALTVRLMQVCGGFFPYKDDEGISKVKTIEAKNAKIERILEDIDEIDDEQPIIIWAAFVPEIELLYKELSKHYSCCTYYGKTPSHKRDKIKQDFMEGKYKIFIGNTAVAGFGLNLQNATIQYYYSNSFSVENRLQAEDRSHRIGVKTTCVYKDVVYKNSIDEKVTNAIKTGRSLNDYFKSNSLKEIFSEE